MPLLEITVQGHLLVAGGQASASGANLTTALRFQSFKDEKGEVKQGRVPYIPATALRGAVRMQLEALLNGGGYDQEVVEPYPFDVPEGKAVPDLKGIVARVFGFSGPTGKRNGAGEGAIRFSDALPKDPARAAAALRVRPGLELENFTSTAEDHKLFFREVAEISAEPLVFRAHLTIVEPARLKERDLERLQAAVEATDAIGAGKARGGGEVSLRWLEEESPTAVRVHGDPATATRARLLFTFEEPAHFGDGGPYANHHATRTFIPGATVRGAIAWTLLRNERAAAEDAAFKALFLEGPPASFGDALLVDDAEAEPAVFSATAQKRRGAENEVRNILVTELARQRVNEALADTSIYLRADDGEKVRFDPVENARPADGLVRHTRTRVSIDRWTGTAAEHRLFSIEQIDPTLSRKDGDKEPVPARFVSWIERLTPASAGLLAQLEGLTVLIGAGRKHGLGLVEVEVRFERDRQGKPAEKVRSLAASIEKRTAEVFRRVEEASSRRGGPTWPPSLPGRPHRGAPTADALPLVLVALSDYVPTERGIDHPLAEPELTAFGVSSPERRFLRQGATGGYDQRPENGAPLKDLLPAVGAGSVFVYSLAEGDLQTTLDRLLPVLRRGVGQRVESGCGRFGLFEPENGEGEKKMSDELTPTVKRWLVGEAEKILDGAKGAGAAFRNQTSQLRNMVQIAQQESEVPVLRNFIRYQSGRKATQRFWSLIQADVIRVLDEIGKQFPGEDPQKAEERRTAIQSFFGYLVRHYVYLNVR
jgi:CRISPR-associated Csx10 family RAMP protein